MTVREIMTKINDIDEIMQNLHALRNAIEDLTSVQATAITEAEIYLGEYIQELENKIVK